jgi:hypothetical protein
MGPDDPTGLPPDEAHVEEAAVEPSEPHCHRCGAPHDRFQEYCLECGARLTPLPAQFRQRTTWTSASGSPLWFWASLLALLVIALITAAVVIAATKDDEKNAGSTSSTLPATVVPTGLTTVPIPPTTLSTVPTLPTTTTFPTTTTAPITTTGPTTDASGLTVWPAGKSGYTIILESVPESSGKSAAETKAKSAQSKGLSQVGVLRTSDYKELTPGYYAVFSGVKDTQAEAEAGISQAKSAGYSAAYVRQIVPK